MIIDKDEKSMLIRLTDAEFDKTFPGCRETESYKWEDLTTQEIWDLIWVHTRRSGSDSEIGNIYFRVYPLTVGL